MKHLAALSVLLLLLSFSVACGSGSGSTEEDPFSLVLPATDQTINRGDLMTIEGTMPNPDDWTIVRFYLDEDETWDNGNEAFIEFATPDLMVSTEWDSVAATPGTYNFVVVVEGGGVRSIGYPGISITVEGEELFTLVQPADNQTLAPGQTFTFEGILRSSDRFDTFEVYLDDDLDWANGAQETLIISTTATANILETWEVSGTQAGTYYIAIALYFSEGGRLVGYVEPTLEITSQSLPD